MASIYERDNDTLFHNLYRVSFVVVLLFGILGALMVLGNLELGIDFSSLGDLVPRLIEVLKFALLVSVAALVVGIVQVIFTSWFGEEIVILTMWLTPFLLMGGSVFYFQQTQDTDVLGGLVAGLVMLALVFWTRKSIRMSARLIEVGAEITRDNLVMMRSQVVAYFLKTVITALMVPGVVTVFLGSAIVNPILGAILSTLYVFMYLFVMSGIQAIADAKNISYVNQWYTGNPSSRKAAEDVSKRKSGVLKYAFLMAFIARFRSRNQQGPLSRVGKLMRFSNWKSALLGGGSLTSAAASAAAYFGSYTLVVMMVKKMNSLGAAYKESAKTVFKTFAANVAGSMGFSVIDGLRRLIAAILLIGIGVFFAITNYGIDPYADPLSVGLIALVFLLIGGVPLDSMFKPVVNSYQTLLYKAYTGSPSSKMDKRTKEIIREAKKK